MPAEESATRLQTAGETVSAPEDATAAAARRAAEGQVSPEWEVGDVILDLYEVTGILGEGGMGKVYKVRHKGWNVDLAVKGPKAEVLAKAGGAETFVRECESWVNLGLHPHTVSCYYVRVLGGIPRVFAEFVEGGSLAEWIRGRKLYEGGPEKALARILDIAIQLAWGLDYAHEQGLVHQDVKPANVMMTPGGLAKVTDFGLAQARVRAEHTVTAALPGHSVLVPGVGLMTPEYCSPEQARREPLSRKTDIWSWGLSVFEMFNGERTWRAGQAAPEALQGYLDADTGDALLPRMPQAVAQLLGGCFAQAPQARPASLKAIAGSLLEVYQNLTGQSYPRREPASAELGADSLNNRALSHMDLGNSEQAETAWQAALAADSQHPESVFNRGLLLWRQGKLRDPAFVRQLEGVSTTHGDSWRPKYMLALVHLERANVDAALPLLEAAKQQAPAEREIQQALELAQSGAIVQGRCQREFEGDKYETQSVYLSADGRLALSGGGDLTLGLWEVATGRRLCIFKGHGSEVRSVCLSADARLALSGSGDKTLRLWEVASGDCLRTFEGHTDKVLSVCLSADARLALSGSSDETLRLWEVATGHCLRTFKGHTDWVHSVCLSADARLALSGSGDKTLRLWEVATGRYLRSFESHTRAVSVCLSTDEHYALSGSEDGTLRLWEVETGRCLRTFEGHTNLVSSVCLSADARLALSGSWDTTLRLWEVASGRSLRPLIERNKVLSVCLSADARYALSGTVREDIGRGPFAKETARETLAFWQLPCGSISPVQLSRLWSHGELAEVDTRANELMRRAEAALESGGFSAALGFLREARALPGKERAPQLLKTWNRLFPFCRRAGLRGAWPVRSFEGHAGSVNSVCLSADGRYALSGSEDHTLRLWEIATGHYLRAFEGHTDEVSSVCLGTDARYALSGSRDKTLRLWEVATGHCLRTLEGHTDKVSSVCLSADGRLALSGSWDKTLRLWEVANGRCLRMGRHGQGVNSVCLSADGRLALSGGGLSGVGNTLELWKVSRWHVLSYFGRKETLAHSVRCVCLSADGRLALSGSDLLGDLELWEVATWRRLRTFRGHKAEVSSVCLSSDARYALSGSSDETLRLWEVGSGRCLRTFQGHTGAVNGVCLSADERYALSGSNDKTLRLWALDWELEPAVSEGKGSWFSRLFGKGVRWAKQE